MCVKVCVRVRVKVCVGFSEFTVTKAFPSELNVVSVHREQPEEKELSSSPVRPCHALIAPPLSAVITTSCSRSVAIHVNGLGVDLDHRGTP